MGEALEALTAFGEFIAGSKALLLALSLATNFWLVVENRRVNQERIRDLKESSQRSENSRALTREVVEVMAAFSRKLEP